MFVTVGGTEQEGHHVTPFPWHATHKQSNLRLSELSPVIVWCDYERFCARSSDCWVCAWLPLCPFTILIAVLFVCVNMCYCMFLQPPWNHFPGQTSRGTAKQNMRIRVLLWWILTCSFIRLRRWRHNRKMKPGKALKDACVRDELDVAPAALPLLLLMSPYMLEHKALWCRPSCMFQPINDKHEYSVLHCWTLFWSTSSI